MSTIIQDLAKPQILETTSTEENHKILSGYVNGEGFVFWYDGTVEQALKQADRHWEAHKKTLYGPTTHIETVRYGATPKVDKYETPE